MSRYTGVTDEDLRAMLGAIGADSLEDLFADIPESVRLGREIDLPPGRSEQEVYEHLASLAARNRSTEEEITFLGAGMYDHYVPGAGRHASVALGVPHAVHAVPARDLAGRAPGDVRVPDGDLGAHRPARLERVRVRGAERRGRGGLPRQARDEAAPPRGEPRAPPALAGGADHARGRLRDGGGGVSARRRGPHGRGGARGDGGRRHGGRVRAAAELPGHGRGPRRRSWRPASAPARCSCARPTRSRCRC